MPPCRPGDIIEIDGETGPGEFAPIIAAHRITVTGHAGLPPVRRIDLDHLLSGLEDSQFVETAGIVRSIGRDDEGHLAVELINARERIPAFVAAIDGQALPAGLGVDAVVRVRAVVGTRFNDDRQMIGVQLFVPTAAEIIVDAPAEADPFALPIVSTARLLGFTSADRAGRMVRIRGVVVLGRDHVAYVRDQAGTIEVRASSPSGVHPGDMVDAVGFPASGAYSPVLEDASVRRSGTGKPPLPVLTTASEILRSGSGRHPGDDPRSSAAASRRLRPRTS